MIEVTILVSPGSSGIEEVKNYRPFSCNHGGDLLQDELEFGTGGLYDG